MSFPSDLRQGVRDALAGLSTDIKDPDASDAIYDLERSMTTEALDKAIEPVLYLNENKAERLSSERQRTLVDELADTIAEAVAYDYLKGERLIRNLSRELEDDLLESYDKFKIMCKEYEEADHSRGRRGGRDRDRERDSEADRRDRKRDRNRSSPSSRQDGRHVNNYDRDEDPSKVKADESRRARRNSQRSEQPAQEEVIVSEVKINNGSAITADNYSALPVACRDIPFYFAGLEHLTYDANAEVININVIEEPTKVDFEKHRTDVFLSNNRDQVNPGKSVEMLEKQLKEAAATKVAAYITATTNPGTAEEKSEEIINHVKIEKSCIVSGTYNITNDAWGCETQIREAMTEMLGEKFSTKLTGVTFMHKIFTAPPEVAKTEAWKEFKDLVDGMAIDTRLVNVKEILLLAQKFFDVKGYNSIHAIYNAAVCNALSCSLKLGIKTTSILADWDDIENLVMSTHATNPYIITLINSNLSSALPSLIIDEDGAVEMLRNYIFLPISKNELGMASPLRYATLNKSVRPEFYHCINKLLTTNVPSDSFKALTTLVTLEDESLILFSNRDMLSDSGYYVFRPI